MKKLTIIVLSFLLMNGCSTLYIQQTAGEVKPHVKKEMAVNEKAMRIHSRELDKIHHQRKLDIERAQSQSWK